MDTYEIELEPAEPEGFIAIVPAVPGLLVLGRSVDEVLERARVAIAYHAGCSSDVADEVCCGLGTALRQSLDLDLSDQHVQRDER